MNYVLSDQQKKELKQAIVEAGFIIDLDVTIYESYSGRFMYGSKCFGFVSETKEAIPYILGHFTGKGSDNLGVELMQVLTVDNLGFNYITYFPGYCWTESTKNEATSISINV